ncbi:POTRA domain-containing protein [Fulvivirgaceae bacterium BMA12]|uniref:POTRA domain-containing protein n=1 Tax=Agaribacillus aureus TaxID=3051825 RepID=A0ABT8L2Q5_9BACT|nr:POTRA domain-containing protein [Fulvivirgaceae bacterium BMA12]
MLYDLLLRFVISITFGRCLVFVLLVSFTFHTHSQTSQNLPDSNPGSADTGGTSTTSSENDVYVTIQNIFITGNKKTKEEIILRELDAEVGDVVLRSDLEKIIENDKNKIVNTQLFLSVDLQIVDIAFDQVEILVKVSERWYLFPVPVFKLEARNFNDWWVNWNRDFDRVSYGIKLYQYNLRGRNERLKLQAQFGFTKRFELDYRIPYIDRSQQNGLILRVGYDENNNVNYLTEDHVQQFTDFGKRTRENVYGSITFSHRPSFYSFHYFSLFYRDSKVRDSIAILNPNYFLDGRTRQQYFRFRYRYRKEARDMIAYPLKGYMFNFEIDKLGLGIYDDINQLEISADYNKFFDLGKNYFLSNRIGGNVSFPRRQPYVNSRALGFRPNFIRGYELNVIEGQSFFLHKFSLKKRIINTKTRLHKIIKKEQFNTIPIAVYLKTYFDGGIVNSTISETENSRLTNRYIFGTGVGLDVVTYYDFVMRLEYSVNNEGERGFFLNFRSVFN